MRQWILAGLPDSQINEQLTQPRLLLKELIFFSIIDNNKKLHISTPVFLSFHWWFIFYLIYMLDSMSLKTFLVLLDFGGCTHNSEKVIDIDICFSTRITRSPDLSLIIVNGISTSVWRAKSSARQAQLSRSPTFRFQTTLKLINVSTTTLMYMHLDLLPVKEKRAKNIQFTHRVMYQQDSWGSKKKLGG